jgi:hypothetical protein
VRTPSTYLHSFKHALGLPPALDPTVSELIDQLTHATGGRVALSLPSTDASELALKAAGAAWTEACEHAPFAADAAASLFHVTHGGTEDDLAAELATALPLTGDRPPPDTRVGGRAGVIKAIYRAAGSLASPFDGPPVAALVTAGDGSVIHHANGDHRRRGHAASALVLSRKPGPFRLVSTEWRSDSELKRLRREHAPADEIRKRAVDLVRTVIETVVAEAKPREDITVADVALMVAPASSDGIESEAFVGHLGGREDAVLTAAEYDDDSAGYLGAADLIVRMAAVRKATLAADAAPTREHDDETGTPAEPPQRQLRIGDWIVLVAAGDDHTAAAVLLQRA